MFQQNAIYFGQFRRNVLAVWRTGCKKISFVQLSQNRETEIQSCFNCDLSFYYLQNLGTADDWQEDFELKKSIDNTDFY